MDSPALPAAAHRWTEGDPVEIAPGVETIARCARCARGMIPKSPRQRFCSTVCRLAAKAESPARKAGDARRSARYLGAHHSYRMARRALRAAGIDPDTVGALADLKGRGKVDGWRALVGLPPERRGVPRAAPEKAPKGPPWGAAVGTQPEHVAWGVDLGGIAGTAPARLVHGLVSRLLGEDHTQVARWALAMPAGARGSGWGVVLFRADDAARLAGRAERVRVGAREVDLRTGPVVRLKAPPMLARGRHRVTVDAVSPVSHLVDGRARPIFAPTVQTILGALGDVSQRLGLSVGRMHVARVACRTAPERVVMGGHMGAVPGWIGRLEIECNAPAAWLLACARHAGLGGRVAFGMGRVRVEVARWS